MTKVISVVLVEIQDLKIAGFIFPRPFNSADFDIFMVKLARNHNVSMNRYSDV